MQKFFLIIALVFPVFISAQFNILTDIQSGAYGRDFNDPLSAFGNIAALSSFKKTSAGISLLRNPSLPELQQIGGIAAIPVHEAVIGLSARLQGMALYRESSVGIAYAKNLGRLAIGGKFNYNKISISGYGRSGAISIDVGLLVYLTDKFCTGFQISNPNRGIIAGQKTPLSITTGIGYAISSAVLISAELIKTEDLPLCVKSVLQYNTGKSFSSAMGMISGMQIIFFRAGWQFDKFRISAGVIIHPELGNTPELNFHYLNSSE